MIKNTELSNHVKASSTFMNKFSFIVIVLLTIEKCQSCRVHDRSVHSTRGHQYTTPLATNVGDQSTKVDQKKDEVSHYMFHYLLGDINF